MVARQSGLSSTRSAHRGGLDREGPAEPAAEDDGAEAEAEEKGAGDDGGGDRVAAEAVTEGPLPHDLVDEAREPGAGDQERDGGRP